MQEFQKLNVFGNRGGWTHTLMCLDSEVAHLEVAGASILNLELIHSQYLPIGTISKPSSIQNWLSRRRIPASRTHLERMEWVIGNIDSVEVIRFEIS